MNKTTALQKKIEKKSMHHDWKEVARALTTIAHMEQHHANQFNQPHNEFVRDRCFLV